MTFAVVRINYTYKLSKKHGLLSPTPSGTVSCRTNLTHKLIQVNQPGYEQTRDFIPKNKRGLKMQNHENIKEEQASTRRGITPLNRGGA